MQNHKHEIAGSAGNTAFANLAAYQWGSNGRIVEGSGSWELQGSWSILQIGDVSSARKGNITRGKSKGVKYIIKVL